MKQDMEAAVKPLLDYHALYLGYNSFLNLDIDQEVRALEVPAPRPNTVTCKSWPQALHVVLALTPSPCPQENEETTLAQIVSWIDKHTKV